MKKILMILLILVVSGISNSIFAQKRGIESFRVSIEDSISNDHRIMKIYKKMIPQGDSRLYKLGFDPTVTSIIGKYDITGVSVAVPRNSYSPYSIDLLVDTGERLYVVIIQNPSPNYWGGNNLIYVPCIQKGDNIIPDKTGITKLTKQIKFGKWYVIVQGINKEFQVNLGLLYEK